MLSNNAEFLYPELCAGCHGLSGEGASGSALADPDYQQSRDDQQIFDSINLGHESKLLNLKSVQLAQQARDEVAEGDVFIAGSMSSMPPLTSHREVAIDGHIESSYQELAESLAKAGVDPLNPLEKLARKAIRDHP